MPRTSTSEIHCKNFGRELRATRDHLGLTQAQLAKQLAVSPSYIAAVEAGRHNVTLGQIANIASAMKVGVSVNFIGSDREPVVP